MQHELCPASASRMPTGYYLCLEVTRHPVHAPSHQQLTKHLHAHRQRTSEVVARRRQGTAPCRTSEKSDGDAEARQRGAVDALGIEGLGVRNKKGCNAETCLTVLPLGAQGLSLRENTDDNAETRLTAWRHGAQLNALGVRVRGQVRVVLRTELDGRDHQVGQHILWQQGFRVLG